jgi:hypothetical protein
VYKRLETLDEPPTDSLERSVLENVLAHQYRRKNMMQTNSALLGVYGSLLAAGGGDSVDIDDLLREMSNGF